MAIHECERASECGCFECRNIFRCRAKGSTCNLHRVIASTGIQFDWPDYVTDEQSSRLSFVAEIYTLKADGSVPTTVSRQAVADSACSRCLVLGSCSTPFDSPSIRERFWAVPRTLPHSAATASAGTQKEQNSWQPSSKTYPALIKIFFPSKAPTTSSSTSATPGSPPIFTAPPSA